MHGKSEITVTQTLINLESISKHIFNLATESHSLKYMNI